MNDKKPGSTDKADFPVKPKRKAPSTAWKPGQSGNPSGRAKLPEEIRVMKQEILQRAIEIMHEKIMDQDFMDSLKPAELDKFLETGYDRFGLPKVTREELTGKDGMPLVQPKLDLSKIDDATLKRIADATDRIEQAKKVE